MADHSPSLFPPPRRMLVRGVNWLGDAVMTTPALLRLRQCFPDAHITLLTPGKLADLWSHHPAVDRILAFAPDESLWSVARGVRTQAFDTALVLPNSPRSALEVWLARVPRRIGYARPWRNWFLSQTVPTHPGHVPMRKRSVSEISRLVRLPPGNTHHAPRTTDHPVHQIHEYLRLAAALGADPLPLATRLEITPAEVSQAHNTLLSSLTAKHHNFLSEKPPVFLGLNPGAEYGPAKRWPAERFAQVAGEVSRHIDNCVWLAFGSAGNSKLCAEMARLAGSRIENLAGKTSLRELMALLKLCRVLLTNDTGPMHVAAALGTPVVVPFGSTSPELTAPGLPGDPRHRLLQSQAPCAPCFRRLCPIDSRCLTDIHIEPVIEAVLQVLSSR